VADIGLMGGPAKLDGKAVEGVKVFTGGKIGEGAELATQIEAGVAAAPEMLVPYLRDLLIREYVPADLLSMPQAAHSTWGSAWDCFGRF